MSILFNNGFNRFLTQMDDGKSMVSLALRDSVESSGRTYMEYKRDPHGGRERLIEEVATTIIWGFGINRMKKVYDYLAKDVTKAIDLPDLDTSLLKQAKAPESNQSKIKAFFNPPSAQSLVDAQGKMKENIREFTEAVHKHAGSDVYGKLTPIIENQSKKVLYNRSNMLKFGFATIMPVLGIAVGIPTFNQWLTRKKLEKEAQGQNKLGASPFKPFSAQAPRAYGQPGVGTGLSTGLSAAPVNSPLNNPAPLPGNPFGAASLVASPFAPGPATASALSFARSAAPRNAAGPVHFGGMMDTPGHIAASLLQNERANTLLVDNIISGGRIAKARNWQERLEIAFRELSIIGCLYWGQQALQSLFINKLGKSSHSQLSFDATKHLRDKFLLPNGKESAQNFVTQYGQHLNDLAKAMELKDRQELLKTLQKANNPQEAYKLDQSFTKAVLKHFEKAQKDRTPNLFLDLAKECHWIPTFDGQVSSSPSGENALKKWFQDAGQSVKTVFSKTPEQYTPKAGKFLDLTKKINSEAMFGFIESMEKAFVSEGLEKAPHKLEKVLQKSIRGRAGAWLASNAVCTLLLSYIIPKTQHYMTYRMTGKNYFPGVEKNA
jgi:hypothetical protein